MEKRFTELKSLLLTREYRPGCVDTAIYKARVVPRAKALKRVTRKTLRDNDSGSILIGCISSSPSRGLQKAT
jgi:hypothetical protein